MNKPRSTVKNINIINDALASCDELTLYRNDVMFNGMVGVVGVSTIATLISIIKNKEPEIAFKIFSKSAVIASIPSFILANKFSYQKRKDRQHLHDQHDIGIWNVNKYKRVLKQMKKNDLELPDDIENSDDLFKLMTGKQQSSKVLKKREKENLNKQKVLFFICKKNKKQVN